MIPNRIEAYCDLKGFAYLREFRGAMAKGSPTSANFGCVGSNAPTPYVVVAEEIDGDSLIVRTWYVMLNSSPDGRPFADELPHRIVSRDIFPGIETPDYDPNASVSVGSVVTEDMLRQIRKARDEMLADRERHLIHAQTYLDALKRADDWRIDCEHLNTVVAAKDFEIAKLRDDIADMRNLAELDRLSITTLQESYIKLENRKSLKTQFKDWCRSWWRRCPLSRVELSD